MNSCDSLRKGFARIAGDESQSLDHGLEAHLASCAGCRDELAEYKYVSALARSVFDTEAELPGAVRTRIASIAAEAALRRPWWRAWGLVPGSPLRPILASSMAMLIVGGVLLMGQRAPSAPEAPEAVRLDMKMDGGKVRLAWTDGKGRAYRVRKSSDPRALRNAEVHAVKGNSWVDADSGSSPVVFYQVD